MKSGDIEKDKVSFLVAISRAFCNDKRIFLKTHATELEIREFLSFPNFMTDRNHSSLTVRVLVALPLPEAYDYAVPEGMNLAPGDYVRVPVGRRQAIGVVWGEGSHQVEEFRLKWIEEKFDTPYMKEEARQFIEWVAQYYMAPTGAVLKMAISAPEALISPSKAISRRQQKEEPLSSSVLSEKTSPTFSFEQKNAVNFLLSAIDQERFSTILLDGVTGSGKTEVFLEAVDHVVSQNRQAVVLVPEIALSAQVVERFTQRFCVAPTVWHSDVTSAQRRRHWKSVVSGEARVVIGARSALFLPFKDLGLIVVDEEHDSSYKQDDGIPYQARDMAVVRAHLAKIPALLVSATPSLETMMNVENGKYQRLHLPTRHGSAGMPTIQIVDVRHDKPGPQRWLAPSLCQAVEETLAAGDQALLFLNRRGYAPLTLCRACGHRFQCPQCDTWLVSHHRTGRLHCHHCGYQQAPDKTCPGCQAEDSFIACGPGVERIAEEVSLRFPQARPLMMTSDTLPTVKSLDEALDRIRSKDVNLIIGTQIVAKGHHFPALTLVGVVDADLGLAGGDLRAAEKTFQLLQQVSGRAGRADKPGRVFLQTYQPHHPVMMALLSNDRDTFLAREADERRGHAMPPFSQLIALIVSGVDADVVERIAVALGRSAPRLPEVTVLGPAIAPLSKIRNKYRWRLLVKAPRSRTLQQIIRSWLSQVDIPRSVKVQIDVDPYGFL